MERGSCTRTDRDNSRADAGNIRPGRGSQAVAKTTEVHLSKSKDSVAMRPMTLEEAIKEAHFRDRDVFVFRDPKGKVMVLHRTRDGKMELIEAP